MNYLFVFAVHNTVVAFVFALLVYGLTHVWRNPPVAHVLWLLVLFKLVAPPVMHVDWFAPRQPESTQSPGQVIAEVSRSEGHTAERDLRVFDRPTARTTAQAPATTVKEHHFAATIGLFWDRGWPVLLWLWLAGALMCALVVATRIVRFERLLRGTLPASERLQRLAFEEDLCCDAWVRWAFPDCTKRYAEVMLKAAESLNASQVGARLLPASPFLRSLSLKARIEMILEGRFAPRLSARSTLVIALLAFLVLPWFFGTTKTEAWAGSNGEAPRPAEKPDVPTTSDFPYAVRFEQGATRFLNGDKIAILEVRGTADTIAPGNIYVIKGTYTLASHDHAKLAASITAMDAANGRSSPLKVQSTVVNEGNGTFTLYLPMSHRGWPHVSFYAADGGESFGGNYFGTGDSVLKLWWGSKEKDRKATSAPTGSNDDAPPPARNPDTPKTSDYPHTVRFEQGATRFLNGDKIAILEVRGTADAFEPGNKYLIKGTYTLASHDRAMLAAYITAMDAANGTGPSLKVQTTVVNQGDGTFTLELPMSCRGWPHVSFYPADGGGDFGGNYFGTGESVLKRWWGL